MSELITNSRLSAFRRCPRYQRLRYVDLLRPVYEDTEKRDWGTVFHAALEVYFGDLQAEGIVAVARLKIEDSDLSDFAKAAALATWDAYAAYWHATDAATKETIAVEPEFEAPVVHPDSLAASALYRIAGKLDGIIRDKTDGRAYVLEHKTTSSDITQGSDYWQRLRIDSQISIYIDGAATLGHHADGALYDVIKRPGQRPHKATPEESRKYKKDGTLYATQRADDETPSEYGARIAEAIAENPAAYFQRATVVRSQDEITEARRDTWQQMRAMHASVRDGSDYRNPDACNRFGSMCGYFDICTGSASADDQSRFVRAEAHSELVNIGRKRRQENDSNANTNTPTITADERPQQDAACAATSAQV